MPTVYLKRLKTTYLFENLRLSWLMKSKKGHHARGLSHPHYLAHNDCREIKISSSHLSWTSPDASSRAPDKHQGTQQCNSRDWEWLKPCTKHLHKAWVVQGIINHKLSIVMLCWPFWWIRLICGFQVNELSSATSRLSVSLTIGTRVPFPIASFGKHDSSSILTLRSRVNDRIFVLFYICICTFLTQIASHNWKI